MVFQSSLIFIVCCLPADVPLFFLRKYGAYLSARILAVLLTDPRNVSPGAPDAVLRNTEAR